MKLKSIFNKVINKNNNQVILNPKKRLIRRLGFDNIDDILEMELNRKLRDNLYKE